MNVEKQVFFVIHTLAIGGAERQIAGLSNYLANHGLDVTIVLLDDDTIQYEIDEKVKVVCLNPSCAKNSKNDKCMYFGSSNTKSISLIERVKLKLYSGTKQKVLDKYLFLKNRYIDNLSAFVQQYPDAVVVTNMLLPNVVGSIALQSLKNKFIFFDASSPEYGLKDDDPMLILRDKYVSRADAAVFQTDVEKEYYKGKLTGEEYIIPNFILTEKLPQRFSGIRKKEIVSFCRLAPIKNIPLLIKAFCIFYKTHPDYQLKIYGDGPEKEHLESLVAELKMEDAIAVCPGIPDVHTRVVDDAVFVSSSDREGLSNSMLEAMAIGLPSVCTDCIGGGARIMIEKYGCGILVPRGDADAIAKAMCDIVENPSLSEELSDKGEAMAKALSIESVGEMWKSII